MGSFLKNHPFAVEAFFESSLVLTFAVPKEQLEELIPESLELDTFQDKWSFIAVAMVQAKGLRPKSFPQLMGNDFFLIGYRIFVRYTTSEGKRLRGLYILKSETNKKKMEFLGNMFTHYNYTTTDIRQEQTDNITVISSDKSAFKIKVDKSAVEVKLPEYSPFENWKEARKFAGPLPFTFSFNPKNNQMLIIEGVRQNWKPRPVKVLEQSFSFIENMNFKNRVLANAFEINNIPYYWKKGRIDQCKN